MIEHEFLVLHEGRNSVFVDTSFFRYISVNDFQWKASGVRGVQPKKIAALTTLNRKNDGANGI